MKTRFFALTMAAALSCGSLPLLAQDAPPPPPPPGSGGEGRPPGGGDRVGEFLKRADADSDGKLSKDEFVNSTKKEAEDRFSRIDSNADGFIEKTEAEEMARRARDAAQQQRPEGMRRPEGSGDRDGGVRPRPGGEGQAGGPPHGPDGPRPEGFRRPEGEGGPRPEGFRRPEGDGSGSSSGMRQGGFGGGGGNFLADRLRRMDKNDDKIVSKEEYLASSEEQFAQMDENKDGKISTEEMDAMGRRMREMMGGGGRGGDSSGGGFRRGGGGEGGRDGGARPRPEGEGERPRRPEGEGAATPPAAPQN